LDESDASTSDHTRFVAHDGRAATTSDRVAPRRDTKFERRVAVLQEKFSSTLRPPPEAAEWPKAVLKRFFEDGGTLTLQSAEAMEEGEKSSLLQYVGVCLPVHVLEPTVQPHGGLLGAAARGETAVFEALGQQLTREGYALAELGAPDCLWPALCAEGRALWPHMSSGILQSHKGVTTSGKDPSGATRGDKYITSGGARKRGRYHALAALDEALALVGTCLNDYAPALGGRLLLRSDPLYRPQRLQPSAPTLGSDPRLSRASSAVAGDVALGVRLGRLSTCDALEVRRR
jgi:hypothetical protein